MPTLNPKLKDFWFDEKGKLIKARNRVLYGGRSSTKSWEFAGMLAFIAQAYSTRVLCVRRYQNKIKDSVYTLIKNQIDNFGFSGYNVRATDIIHNNGSEMVFYGIERNVDEIKSFEGADILWIEEAHNLTKEQWEILEPTIRKEGSEVWISFNPRYATDFIYQKFIVNTPKNTIVRKINYTDNPFISKTMLDIIEDLKERDFEAYEHIYLGVPRSENAQTIIKREWLESAIDLHKSEKIKELGLDLTGQYFVGYDVADSGDDKNATTVVCGSIIEDCTEWQGRENELRKSAEKVKHLAMEKSGKLIYDSIGVGAHVGSTLQASGFFEFYPFNAGAKVFKPNQKYKTIKNKDFFANLKAQAWWLVADRFANTYDFVVNGNHNYKPSELISINSKIKNLDQLLTELSTPLQDIDSAGRVKVESKKDLAKRGVVSPNKADSCIMALSFNLVAQKSMNALDIRGF